MKAFSGKHVNHSFDADTRAINGFDVAKRKIKKGEETAADYIFEIVPNFTVKRQMWQ